MTHRSDLVFYVQAPARLKTDRTEARLKPFQPLAGMWVFTEMGSIEPTDQKPQPTPEEVFRKKYDAGHLSGKQLKRHTRI
jgi:hypothetical protein